ncbi:MAG: twin-arginine translocase TatA/TatE family subunit [Saccharolobus sp.]|nr:MULTISPECIES: twin-arginine translocase TatA/TatE family subunit [Saccharolobus]MDT7861761.1 twin-arginine translocase TatA/TatE family subunit [Saccharolobus sp.]
MLENPTDLIILLVVIAVLFFGSSKIPELFRSLGRAMGEFKKGQIEAEMEIQQMMVQNNISKRDNVEDLERKIAELQKQLEELKQSKK